jgi:hypothetical protein
MDIQAISASPSMGIIFCRNLPSNLAFCLLGSNNRQSVEENSSRILGASHRLPHSAHSVGNVILRFQEVHRRGSLSHHFGSEIEIK